jgi:hypothetical protein
MEFNPNFPTVPGHAASGSARWSAAPPACENAEDADILCSFRGHLQLYRYNRASFLVLELLRC